MPLGLVMGAGCSLGMTLALSAVAAKLIDSGTVGEGSIGYCAMIILMLSAWIGAAVSWRKIKRQRLAVIGISGVVYYAILLSATALFFGGQYRAMGVTALMVLCGCGLALLMGMQKGKKGGRHKAYRRGNR